MRLFLKRRRTSAAAESEAQKIRVMMAGEIETRGEAGSSPGGSGKTQPGSQRVQAASSGPGIQPGGA